MSGKIEALEDVDCFKFKARAGQTITFEVYCARIEDKIHDLQKHLDPLLTLYDAQGRELAAEATKHLNADLFTQPGLPDHQLQTLFSVLRDLRREAGDFA